MSANAMEGGEGLSLSVGTGPKAGGEMAEAGLETGFNHAEMSATSEASGQIEAADWQAAQAEAFNAEADGGAHASSESHAEATSYEVVDRAASEGSDVRGEDIPEDLLRSEVYDRRAEDLTRSDLTDRAAAELIADAERTAELAQQNREPQPESAVDAAREATKETPEDGNETQEGGGETLPPGDGQEPPREPDAWDRIAERQAEERQAAEAAAPEREAARIRNEKELKELTDKQAIDEYFNNPERQALVAYMLDEHKKFVDLLFKS
jgi:hypothetical protein